MRAWARDVIVASVETMPSRALRGLHNVTVAKPYYALLWCILRSTFRKAGPNDRLTGEMTETAAQVPALFKALRGMKTSDLMSNVKQMRVRVDGETNTHPIA